MNKEDGSMTKGCLACLTCACIRPEKARIRDNAKKTDTFQDMKDIHIDPTDLKRYLLENGIPEVNIEMFMERFNIAGNDALDGNESHQLLSDITHNTYILKSEVFESIRKRHPDENPLPQFSNAEKAYLLEKAEMEM
jgi:hypothetical protein